MQRLVSLVGILALTAGCMQNQATTATPDAEPAPQQSSSAVATDTFDVTVDNTFGGFAMGWDRQGGQTIARYKPVMKEGVMYLCGAYAWRGGANISNVSRQLMQRTSVMMDGRVAFRDVRFFNTVPYSGQETALEGTTATCKNTGLTPNDQQLATLDVRPRTGRFTVN